jgi:hypothetical protein
MKPLRACHADAIAAIDVDCVVGHFDLSVSSAFSQFDHPKFKEAKKIIALPQRNKVLPAMPTVDQGVDFFAQGRPSAILAMFGFCTMQPSDSGLARQMLVAVK